MGVLVETNGGTLEGRESDGVRAFLGIPYAEPPVGELRFAAPRPAAPWKGVRTATEFGAGAPQMPMMIPIPGMEVSSTDESCLSLNVWAPATDGTRRPVLFFVHGGAFVLGAGSQAAYHGEALAQRGDVVVVTINYRLGALGFLHLAEVCPGLGEAVSNPGLRDQILALRWVQQNISAFGGDPENVTIFGESAGGMSVGALLGAPQARGLFHRAIAQSGACHNVSDPEAATKVARAVLDALGLSPATAERELRNVSAVALRDAASKSFSLGGVSLPFQPVVDGDSLPAAPLEAVRAGAVAEIDLLVGTTRDEMKLFGMMDPGIAQLTDDGLRQRVAVTVGEAAGDLVAAYRTSRPDAHASELFFAIETDRTFRIPAIRLAETQRAHGERVFMYRVDWESPFMDGRLGACHGVEIPFVFGNHTKPGADFFVGSGPAVDHLAEVTMDAWIAFARDGVPRVPSGVWPAYDPERRATQLLGPEIGVLQDPDPEERRAWGGLR